ncbi:c-type cytochrome [Corallincola platygyrae]|uniref:C-type cytochrome n=1 Tax=Corallincola platygyrae TaxID=1193278 RepID=A0ABW4XLV0_9GAMM
MATPLQQLLIAGLAGMVLATPLAAKEPTNDEIQSRIKPVGELYIEGDAPAVAAAAEPAGPRSGADIYQAACFACHGTGALNAPKKDDANAWAPRLAQGMDVVLKHAIDGFNAMPPRGTCADCSDEDIQAAIDYMVEGI